MSDSEKNLSTLAKTIAELKRKNDAYELAFEKFKKIQQKLFCVGGALNDNRLGYNKEQLKDFWYINQIVEEIQSILEVEEVK